MSVLVVVPHMDDEVLGCGGAIARHVDEGMDVHVCVVCNRAYDRVYDAEAIEREQSDARRAQEILGYTALRFLDLPDERLYAHFQEVLEAIEAVAVEVEPEIVYTCHAGDLHQDHRVVAHASNIVFRSVGNPRLKRVLAYEVPSATDQVFPGFADAFCPTFFVAMNRDQLARKVRAMEAYERESRSPPHPRSPEMLQARAQVRGSECARSFAEAFVLLREVV